MREAAEKLLREKSNFKSIVGTAEDTMLENSSIDLVIAGQAFHWFDIAKAKKEFRRIKKNNHYAALFWNERKSVDSAFLAEYEEMLKKYCDEYEKAKHSNIRDEVFRDFYGNEGYKLEILNNFQMLDWEGLKGRTMSASYSPTESEQGYPGMLNELKRLFDKYGKNNIVKFDYETKLYYGKIV